MDTTIRDLERAVATGEPGAASALRRARNRAGEGVRVYTIDLAREVNPDRHGSFAAHAAGVRAVLKKNELERHGLARARVVTESYSMCHSILLRIEAEHPNSPTGEVPAFVRDQARLDREALGAKITEALGVLVSGSSTGLEIWQRGAEPQDPGADYGTRGAGPTIRPDDQECYLAAFVKVEERKAKKAAVAAAERAA